jgi:hypothetical protein
MRDQFAVRAYAELAARFVVFAAQMALWYADGHIWLGLVYSVVLTIGFSAKVGVPWVHAAGDAPTLGASVLESRHPAEARRLLKRLMSARMSVFSATRLHGHDHRTTLILRHRLANALVDAGHLHQGIAVLEQTLADHERVLGPDHAGTMWVGRSLATNWAHAGRVEEAVALAERLCADSERVFGSTDSRTLASRHVLALVHGQAGRTEEAIHLCEQVLADCRRVLGPQHSQTTEARDLLTTLRREAGHT